MAKPENHSNSVPENDDRKKDAAPDDEEALPDHFQVTDVLDLHGFFPEQIPEVVEEFIRYAVELNLHELYIIHGKGRSKLKYLVRKELEKNKHVKSFRDAPPELGGWGRTVVYI